MEGTGVSLFQGSEVLNLNLTNQEEEEAEVLEEEKRRNAQVKMSTIISFPNPLACFILNFSRNMIDCLYIINSIV